MSETKETNFINLADFDEPLATNEVAFDPAATQSGPPPIPESKDGYVVKLKFAKDDRAEWWKAKEVNGVKQYLYTSTVAEVLEGDYAGRKLRDFVSTQVSPYDKTTKTNIILHAIGDPVTAQDVAQFGPHKANAQKFEKNLLLEPSVRVFVQWQAKFLIEGTDGKKVAATMLKDGKEIEIKLRGGNKPTWPKDGNNNPRTSFTLEEAFPEFAGTEYATTPAYIDAAIVRYAPTV